MIEQWTRVTSSPDLPDIETYVRDYKGMWLSVQKGYDSGKYWAFVGSYIVGRRATVAAAQKLAERSVDNE